MNVHILDCVKIPLTYENKNYELSTVITYEKKKMRGYKLGVLRRVTEFYYELQIFLKCS